MEVRERTAGLAAALEAQFDGRPARPEYCVVATCNRVECYLVEHKLGEDGQLVRDAFQRLANQSAEEIAQHLYDFRDEGALRHLFRVAASLDSMVLGEPQILGQLKDAYRTARTAATLGSTLGRTMDRAFSVAKRVRSETRVAENAVSMSYAAVELGREIFDDLRGRQVLLLGAGKMATLAAKHLQMAGAARVVVVNRTLASAERLARAVEGVAAPFDKLSQYLAEVDIVISSTAATEYVVTRSQMQSVVRERRYRPILFVDIAVPRDIDPEAAELDNVFVYDVDDLEAVLELNRESRAREAEAADRIVLDEVQAYHRWLRSQQVVPAIKALRAKAEAIVAKEVERTAAQLGGGAAAEKALRRMGSAMLNRMLHPVFSGLKNLDDEALLAARLDATMALFDLELGSEPDDEAPTQDISDAEAKVVPIRDPAKGAG